MLPIDSGVYGNAIMHKVPLRWFTGKSNKGGGMMMDFYADLSQYYEAIFPLTGDKVSFTKAHIPEGGSILDIGCGTGELVMALAKDGYRSSGVDLSAEMIEKARGEAKAQGLAGDFQVGDMRKLHQLYQEPLNGVLCFGNTIVHLTNMQEIREFFAQVFELLHPGGRLLFQIVNYDRILAKRITELPVIKNDEKQLTFYRHYDYDSTANLIHFNTRLVVNGEEKTHSVPLYPLTSGEIKMMLGAEGFQKPEFFGDFAQHPFDPDNSGALVVVVQR